MKKLIFFLFVVLTCTAFAQPTFIGGIFFGSGDGYPSDMILKINKDQQLYTCGSYIGKVNFNPGGGEQSISGSGFFVCKYGLYGNLVWVKHIQTSINNYFSAMDVDTEGNIILLGSFTGNMDCDPGPLLHNIIASDRDIFLLKLDKDGNFLWVNRLGDNFAEYAGGLAVAAAGDIYMAGMFFSTIDIDPGVNFVSATSGSIGTAMFIEKVNKEGDFVWANVIPAPLYQSFMPSVRIDKNNDLIISGAFGNKVDFDPGPLTATLISESTYRNGYVAKYDSSGKFKWAKKFAEGYVLSAIPDTKGNIFCAGGFSKGDFDPGTGTHSLTAVGGEDVFGMRLDVDGNMIWTKTFGSVQDDFLSSSIIDHDNNIYLAGTIVGTTDFDPGNGTYLLSPAQPSISNIFLNKLDENGNFDCAGVMHTDVQSWGARLAIDQVGQFFMAGFISDTTDIDMGASSFYFGSPMYQGTFLSKSHCGLSFTGVDEKISNEDLIKIYPVPAQDFLNIESNSEHFTLRIFDVYGKLIVEKIYTHENAEINLSQWPSGFYVVEVLTDDYKINRKIIK